MATEHVVWRRHDLFAEQQHPQGQENPLFPNKRKRQERRKKAKMISLIVFWAVIVLGCLYALFLSSFFRIEVISVEGNRFTASGDIRTQIQAFLDTKIFKIIPRNTFFLASRSAIQKSLLSSISVHQAIDELRVERHLPSRIHVVIRERTPNLLFENGGQAFLVDREGIVVQAVDAADHVDPSFPTLLDQTTRPVAVGGRVLAAEQVRALFEIDQQLKERTDIPIERLYLPPAQCTKFFAEEPEQGTEEASDGEATANTNSRTNENRNATTEKKSNVNSSSNINASNTNVSDPIVVCDKSAEVLKGIEIRARSTENWEIYFRIDDSIEEQVTRLLRVLKEKHLDRAQLDYIDLRFGDRVIIK